MQHLMDNHENFADRLIQSIEKKASCVVVGLDPRLQSIPQSIQKRSIDKHGSTLKAAVDCILEFNCRVIDVVSAHVIAVKPQIAFYEQYGSLGLTALEATIDYAKESGLIVIIDAKRNDIGSTAEAYANGYIGRVHLFGSEVVKSFFVDAITVNPYLGSDCILPFTENVKRFGTGIFILVRTSNPSAHEVQDIQCGSKKLYEKIGLLVNRWGENTEGISNYRSVGAVVGATYPTEAAKLRKLIPNSFFLVPGYGTQGAIVEDVAHCFNKDGLGAIISSSRGIIFAHKCPEWEEQFGEKYFEKAIEVAVIKMKEEINSIRYSVNAA